MVDYPLLLGDVVFLANFGDCGLSLAGSEKLLFLVHICCAEVVYTYVKNLIPQSDETPA